jgi:hypothetical protein
VFIEQMFNSIIAQLLVISQENNTKKTQCYTFLTRLLYNAAMKKGIPKEEDVVKILITSKRERDEFDDYILKKFIEKKKGKKSN